MVKLPHDDLKGKGLVRLMTGKIAGAVMVIISFSGLGFWLAGRRILCRKQLLELKRLLMILGDEIRFAHTPLPEALKRIGNKASPPFFDVFCKMGESLIRHETESFYDVWSAGVHRLFMESCIKWEDLEELDVLGKNLGSMDFEAQLNRLNLYLMELDERLKWIQEENREKVRLYRLFGILSGIFITILLV